MIPLSECTEGAPQGILHVPRPGASQESTGDASGTTGGLHTKNVQGAPKVHCGDTGRTTRGSLYRRSGGAPRTYWGVSRKYWRIPKYILRSSVVLLGTFCTNVPKSSPELKILRVLYAVAPLSKYTRGASNSCAPRTYRASMPIPLQGLVLGVVC